MYARMSHTIREKRKLLIRVRRILGQMKAVERGLENEVGCEQIMHLIASARAAMAGLMSEVVADHVQTHLVKPERQPVASRREAAEELLAVVRAYLR
jgi:FrmR/RcnR family transcriptional regulator, repressor of frmRAB operon